MALHRSVRPIIQAITIGIAAVLTLGACGTQLPGQASNASQAQPTASGAASQPVAAVAPRPTASGHGLVAATTAATPTQVSAAPAGPALSYVKLVEPFSAPGKCNPDGNTGEMTDCALDQVISVDAMVDRLQRQRFEHAATRADQKADLRDDARWLKARTASAGKNLTGGSIDPILEAQTLLKVSQERVSFLTSTK